MTLQKQLEYNNILEWHENGITGKGVNQCNEPRNARWSWFGLLPKS